MNRPLPEILVPAASDRSRKMLSLARRRADRRHGRPDEHVDAAVLVPERPRIADGQEVVGMDRDVVLGAEAQHRGGHRRGKEEVLVALVMDYFKRKIEEMTRKSDRFNRVGTW